MEEDIWLKEGYIVYMDDPLNDFFRIVRREPFDYETGTELNTPNLTFSALSPGAVSGFITIADLEPDNRPEHLFQVLWGVRETGPDIKYYAKIPAGQNRFGVDQDKEVGFIDAGKSPWYDPNPLYQFWLVNDWVPAIECRNQSAVTFIPKVWFKGMKYDIEKVINQQLRAALSSGAQTYRKIVFGGVKNTP
jgi:hypothetical protein